MLLEEILPSRRVLRLQHDLCRSIPILSLVERRFLCLGANFALATSLCCSTIAKKRVATPQQLRYHCFISYSSRVGHSTLEYTEIGLTTQESWVHRPRSTQVGFTTQRFCSVPENSPGCTGQATRAVRASSLDRTRPCDTSETWPRVRSSHGVKSPVYR